MSLQFSPFYDQVVFDNSGNLATGGTLNAYYTGTSNPAPIYNENGNEISQPIVISSNGRVIYKLDTNLTYRIVIQDSMGVTIRDADGVTANGSESAGIDTVKVSNSDTVSQYLGDKIVAGTDITVTKLTDAGGVETLQISANGGSISLPSSANWNSTYSTVLANSASWDESADVTALSAAIDTNSANIATNDTDIANNAAAITANTTLANGKVASVNGGANINVTGTTTPTVNLDTSISDAIDLNTAKDGITTAQANAITANTAKVGITNAQANAITANTAKDGITTAQATAITTNTAKVGITPGQASEITANTLKTGITTAQASEIAANTLKTGITTAQATAITTNTAGIATNVTDIAANASAISGLAKGLDYQGTWNASTNSPTLASSVGTEGHYYIVGTAGNTNLNGITDWKVGDWVLWSESGTSWQKVDNTSFESVTNQGTGAEVFKQIVNGTEVQLRTLTDGTKISFTQNANDIEINDSVIAGEVNANTAKVGITTAQANDITTNNAKTGITNAQATNITTNNAKVGITTAQSNAITANTAKDGITTVQANAITANTAKTGITTAQANAIIANTAKGGGDVDGPGSNTLNAIPVYNGTSGKIIKDSGVLIDSSDNVTVPGTITVTNSPIVGSQATGLGQAISTNTLTDIDDYQSGTFLLSPNSAIITAGLPPTFATAGGRHTINTISNASEVGAQLAFDSATNSTNQMAYRVGDQSWKDWVVVAGTNLENTFTSAQTINSTLDVTGTIKAGGNGNDATKFLNGTGAYSVPAGGSGTSYWEPDTTATAGGVIKPKPIVNLTQKLGGTDDFGLQFGTESASTAIIGSDATNVNVWTFNTTKAQFTAKTINDSGKGKAIYGPANAENITLGSVGGQASFFGNDTAAYTLNYPTLVYMSNITLVCTGGTQANRIILAAPMYVRTLTLTQNIEIVGANLYYERLIPGAFSIVGNAIQKFWDNTNGGDSVFFRNNIVGNTPNLNSNTDQVVEWNGTSSLKSSSGIIHSASTNAGRITVTEDGEYDVYSSLYFQTTTSTQRAQLRLSIYVDGVLVPEAGMGQGGYARGVSTSLRGMSNINSLVQLTAGQYIEIRVKGDGLVNSSAVNLIGPQCIIKVTKLQGARGETGATGAASLIRTVTTTTTTTLPSNADTTDIRTVTALTSAMLIQNPTGTPINGQVLKFRITDSGGSSGTLTYGVDFRFFATKPTSITSGKTLYIGCIYNSDDSKWDVVAAVEEI
jgi:hypothetical protein